MARSEVAEVPLKILKALIREMGGEARVPVVNFVNAGVGSDDAELFMHPDKGDVVIHLVEKEV